MCTSCRRSRHSSAQISHRTSPKTISDARTGILSVLHSRRYLPLEWHDRPESYAARRSSLAGQSGSIDRRRNAGDKEAPVLAGGTTSHRSILILSPTSAIPMHFLPLFWQFTSSMLHINIPGRRTGPTFRARSVLELGIPFCFTGKYDDSM